jgi:hypothetical protein
MLFHHPVSVRLHFQSQIYQIKAELKTQQDGTKLYQGQKRMNLTRVFVNL